MKRLANLATLIVMMLAWACTPAPTSDNQEAVGLKTPVLSADVEALSVDSGSDLLAVVFSWTNVATDEIVPTYELIIAEESDTEFEKAESFICNSVRKPFSHKEIADLIDSMGCSLEDGVTLKAIVHASAEGFDPVTSNVVTLKLSEGEAVPEKIYIAGYAISRTVAYALTGIPASHFLQPVDGEKNTYTWTGKIEAGDGLQFKFLASHVQWVPSYNRDATSSEYWKLVYRTSYSEPDEQFQVDVTGTYKITLNTKTLTISCELQQ